MPLGLDVELPTAYGWTKVRDLTVGMELLDETGFGTRVRSVSVPYRAAGFSLRWGFGKVKSPEPDGELVCGEGQRFLLARHSQLERWRGCKQMGELPLDWRRWAPGGVAPFVEERTVEEVAAGVHYSRTRGEGTSEYLNWAVPTTGSLQLQGGRNELDPWVAGVCINFWDAARGELKLRANEMDFYTRRFAAAGYSLKIPAFDEKRRYTHVWCGVDEVLEKQLVKYLNRGLIPNWVFRAPERDRMEFLAGLMDRWDFEDYKNNVRNGAWFYTTDGVLGRQVAELVRTLGYPATLRAAKQVRKDRDGETHYSGFYVLWQPLVLPFTKPELLLRYSHMTYRAGSQVQRFLWKIYEAREIEHIMVRDIIVEGPMFAAGKLLVPVRGDDRGEES